MHKSPAPPKARHYDAWLSALASSTHWTMGRQFLAFILSLALVATSSAMSAARGSAQPGTFMVICTGAGVTSVILDEDGEPIEALQVCPDCALNTLTGQPPAPFALAPQTTDRRGVLNADRVALTSEFTGPVLPRGPPIT